MPTASYTQQVSLDPTARTLKGTQLITWRNSSNEPLKELYLHLYWNAFKNHRSLYFSEGGKNSFRRDAVKYDRDDWGWIELTSFQQGQQELIQGLEYREPDPDPDLRVLKSSPPVMSGAEAVGTPAAATPQTPPPTPTAGEDSQPVDDLTVVRIPLSSPIAPGEQVTFRTTFEAKIPRVLARAGFVEDYFLIGQWFPKLGVLNRDRKTGATLPTWNCHSYHHRTEFFADFGSYDVSITVPSRFVVGATGVRKSRTDHPDGTTTHRFLQDNVQDFAFTAWPEFVELTDRFEAPGLNPVDIVLLCPPEFLASAPVAFESVKQGFRSYGERFFPYPHPQLTVVIPPVNAEESGGMEYPTFITTGGARTPGEGWGIRNVTVHELGHNYFQGMLASNEFEEAWLDEGFNTYATNLALDDAGKYLRLDMELVPGWSVSLPFPDLPMSLLSRGMLATEFPSPIMRNGWEYLNGMDYSINSYGRTALVLTMLERYLGDTRMRAAMKAYTERFKFLHPTAEDFFQTVEEVSGEQLDWFFDQFFRQNLTLDYSVTSLEREKREKLPGWYGFGNDRTYIEPPPEGPRGSLEKKSDSPTDLWRSTVIIQRLGSAYFPVTIRVSFEDNTTQDIQWDGRDDWKRLTFDGHTRVIKAEVDPDHIVWMDKNWLNNGRVFEQDKTTHQRITGLLLTGMQMLVSMLFMLV